MNLPVDDPLAVSATDSIHQGDLLALRLLLADHPELVAARIGTEPDGMSRTLLQVATDWPGRFPNNVETVWLLIEAGAEVDARFTGPHTETPGGADVARRLVSLSGKPL